MERTILLTLEQVREWQREMDDLMGQEAKLRERRAFIQKRLDAAAVFFDPAQFQSRKESSRSLIDDKRSGQPAAGSDSLTLIDAIERVVVEAGVPLTNAQIKRKLAGTGFDVSRLEDSPNYFYTATKRVVKRGSIRKLPNGSYVASKSAEAPEGSSAPVEPSEASIERRIDHPAEPQPSGPVEPVAGGGT